MRRSRRDVLAGMVAVVASALVSSLGFAKGHTRSYRYVCYHDNLIELQQYERLRMIRDGVTSDGGPVFTTDWAPVAFWDIGKGDLIRKATAPKEGMWLVEGCKRQCEGVLEVSPVTHTGPIVVDLLSGNLRMPRLC